MMSGATVTKITHQYYRIRIETPSMVFPRRSNANTEGRDVAESRFHNNAKNKFADFTKKVIPKLDVYIDALIAQKNNKYQITEYKKTVILDEHNRERLVRKEVSHCCINFVNIGSVSNVFSFISMELTFAGIPSKEAISNLEKKLRRFFTKYKTT